MNSENNNLNFLDKMLLNNEAVKLAESGTDIKQLLTYSFDTKLIYIKIVFIILIIIMTINTGYTTWIKNNKIKFTIETILYGLISTIPFLYMEKYRKSENYNFLIIFVSIFFLYAGINVLFELSGFYYYLYNINHSSDTDSHKEQTESTKITNKLFYSLIYTIIIILVYMILSMIIISYKVGNFNIEAYNNNFYTAFITEIIVFALINSLPFLLIAYNRQGSKFKFGTNFLEVFLIFIKFIILHLMFQTSGFYHENFGY